MNLVHIKLHHKTPVDDKEEDIESMIRRIVEFSAYLQTDPKTDQLEIEKLKKICRSYITTWKLCRNQEIVRRKHVAHLQTARVQFKTIG